MTQVGDWSITFLATGTFDTGLAIVLETPKYLPSMPDHWVCWLGTSDEYSEVGFRRRDPHLISRSDGEAIIEQLHRVKFGIIEPTPPGCDGTTFVLTVGSRYGGSPTLSLTWWGELPAEWAHLQPVVDGLMKTARDLGWVKQPRLGPHDELVLAGFADVEEPPSMHSPDGDPDVQ
jgi:hypothetical protein